MPVNSTHPQYDAMLPRWRRCRDVAAGQDAVHDAGVRYLPKLKEEDDQSYRARVQRATFYNATWRTISGLIGMLLRQPPRVELPAPLDAYAQDVTLDGTPLQLFVQEVCEEALKVGRLGVLVDYPVAGSNPDGTQLTQADVTKLNLRPTMQLYYAEAILNWRTASVNNQVVLTLVVLQEEVQVPVDEFTSKAQKRWRVLDLAEGKYRVRLYEKAVDGSTDVQLGADIYPLQGGTPLPYIPFKFISTDSVTPEVDEPPLIDLVNTNLSHYRSTADLEHGAHFTGLPTAWITGYKAEAAEKFYIGSAAAWVFPGENVKVGYLEFHGDGLKTLVDLIDDKESQMAILGARMLEPQKRGVESAESVAIHRKGEESMLSAIAQAISLAITDALRWFAAWGGALPGGVVFELNRDFYPQPMTFQMLTALVAAWQSQAISHDTLFKALQQGEVVAQDKTLEEEQSQISTDPPPIAPPIVLPKGSAVPADRGSPGG